jgi:hypothetical protein
MPTFFFDIDDGDEVHQDPEGIEFDDVLGACEHAEFFLVQAARELIPGTGSPRRVEIKVRDAGQADVLIASVYIEVRFLDRNKLH